MITQSLCVSIRKVVFVLKCSFCTSQTRNLALAVCLTLFEWMKQCNNLTWENGVCKSFISIIRLLFFTSRKRMLLQHHRHYQSMQWTSVQSWLWKLSTCTSQLKVQYGMRLASIDGKLETLIAAPVSNSTSQDAKSAQDLQATSWKRPRFAALRSGYEMRESTILKRRSGGDGIQTPNMCETNSVCSHKSNACENLICAERHRHRL